MQDISSSDLKTILHSKRANIYYLEHCRVLTNGGRVEYLTEAGKDSLYWNIPIANTTTILLGTGTSITQSAMRGLAKAGVLVGFCGGGGTPLFSTNEFDFEVSWFSPQCEYRPTEYLQSWVQFWFDDKQRLDAAKTLQLKRLNFICHHWAKKDLREEGFLIDLVELQNALDKFRDDIPLAQDTMQLLTMEARLSKLLFRFAAKAVHYGDFARSKKGQGTDPANVFLDHGNYLAYGLGASATWVLGLPHGLAVLHGKTRRGGLVFDAADLIKDALVLPLAFVAAVRGDDISEFRQACIRSFTKNEALDFIIDSLKEIALTTGETH
ncbi:MAG: type I-F CRISPR-associated endonuclease Cas1 [Chlorobium sp.]|nr:MAG: type I-F CRISPR-associated endonuclease Cas1 [Chlorobium sp.]